MVEQREMEPLNLGSFCKKEDPQDITNGSEWHLGSTRLDHQASVLLAGVQTKEASPGCVSVLDLGSGTPRKKESLGLTPLPRALAKGSFLQS